MLTIAKRTIFDLMWDDRPEQRCWVVKVGPNVVFAGRSMFGERAAWLKKTLVKHWAFQCTNLMRDGYPCQLRIHDKAGKFQSERTYPDTTRDRKG